MPSDHSKFFSPSSGARLLTCLGSAKASEGIPEQISLFANEGTDAHELAEIRLKESNGQSTTSTQSLQTKSTRAMHCFKRLTSLIF